MIKMAVCVFIIVTNLVLLKIGICYEPPKMDPNIPPKAMTDPTQEDPSSSIPNPVELLLSCRLAAFVQPVKFPQLNIPIETLREKSFQRFSLLTFLRFYK